MFFLKCSRRAIAAYLMRPKCARRHVAFVSSSWCLQSGMVLDDDCIKPPHEIPPRNMMMMIRNSHHHYLPGRRSIQFDDKLMMMMHVRRGYHNYLEEDDVGEELCRYVELGLLREARTLFDEVPMAIRSISLWESIIDGYVYNDYIDEARQLFDSSPKTDNASLWDLMIYGYARCGMSDEAIRIFYKHPEKCPNCWHSMIWGLVDGGNCNEARRFFDYMPCKDEYALILTLHGYLETGMLDEAIRFLFDNDKPISVEAWNFMMAAYKREGMFDEATRIFQRIKSVKRSLRSWNLMITMHARRGMLDEAKKYFHHIMPTVKKHETSCWNAMIHGYLVNGMLDEARRCFDSIPIPCSTSHGLMIAGYLQNGMLDEARRIFDHVITHNSAMDLHYWVLMLVGFARNGMLVEASQLFDRLFEVKDDPRSWDLITRACIKHGFYQEVVVVLKFMEEKLGIDLFLDEITLSMVEVGKDYCKLPPPFEVESGEFIQVTEGNQLQETFILGNWWCCPIVNKLTDKGNGFGYDL